MLPSNLLAVWKRRGNIYPRYKHIIDKNLRIAKSLIEVYKTSIGKKKSSIKDYLATIEDYDYRFIRGLSVLLDRRSIFKCKCSFDPKKIRHEVFKLTGKLGPATNSTKRNQILKEASKNLSINTKSIENEIYADLDSELILESFSEPSPKELLETYNISLTQTLLFDSVELQFTTSHNWQKIFFKAKKLGLIYEAFNDDGLWIKIDGPSCLFKLTRRYGSNISKLIPSILGSQNWRIEAKILWKYTNEICSFKISSIKHKELFGIQNETETYDSIVEADFASRFQALKTNWILKREPEPLIAGKHVLIPDFSFERDSQKVYMEVVGFWTTDYLSRKIKKLKEIKSKIIVAIDQNLACEAISKLKKYSSINIFYYKKKIPLAPVLNFLKATFKGIHTKQLNFLKDLEINFTEPIVNFSEFAERIGVSIEAVRDMLTQNPPKNYIIWSKGLIRKDKVDHIKKKIDQMMENSKKLSLTAVTKIVNQEGVDSTSIINSFGYKIIWHGLDINNAEIVPVDD
jgi:predicted nuclease of restriction endonuclease-like RecB superfamily